jgi:hypothetical protein
MDGAPQKKFGVCDQQGTLDHLTAIEYARAGQQCFAEAADLQTKTVQKQGRPQVAPRRRSDLHSD